MTSASQMLWNRIAPPAMSGCADINAASCWVCGGAWTRGVALDAWLTDTFTAHTRARCPGATIVCEPCAWVCARLSPVPGRPPKEGKAFGGNFRNYSHVFDADDYQNFSKGEKPKLLAWLRGPRRGEWFAAIADSGQKHVVPWAPINPAGVRRGVVLFEEQIVQLPDAAGWSLVDEMAALLTLGATKEEIERGDYGARAWQLAETQLRVFEDEHGRERGSSWFALAVWLAQRDEAQAQARMSAEKEANANAKTRRRSKGVSGIANGDAATGGKARVSRRRGQPVQTLGPDHRPPTSGDADFGDSAGVGDGHNEIASTRRPVQRSLFGD